MKNIYAGLILCVAFFSCWENKDPYENSLGIDPAYLAQRDTANYTKIEWKDSVVNIGSIKTTDTARIQFRFTNTGERPLFIVSVAPACGCTVADYSKEPILPGKEGMLKAEYKWNGQLGKLRKTISIRTNTRNGAYHMLAFEGEVIKDAVK